MRSSLQERYERGMVTDSPHCSEEIPKDGNADSGEDPSEIIATLPSASAPTQIRRHPAVGVSGERGQRESGDKRTVGATGGAGSKRTERMSVF